MKKYYFEILETEYTYNVIAEVIGDIATFEGTEEEYNELKEYEVFDLETNIGTLFFHHEDIKLIGCYDIKTVNIYDRCIKEIDEFEGNSTFNELLDDNNNNLGDAIENLKGIVNRILEELYEDQLEEIKFYNEILTKINTIA